MKFIILFNYKNLYNMIDIGMHVVLKPSNHGKVVLLWSWIQSFSESQ